MKLFIDTWGWLNIFNQHENHHQITVQYYQNFIQQGGQIYTTDYILDETLTLLSKRRPFLIVQQTITTLDAAIDTNFLIMAWMTPKRFAEAKQLRLKFHDKLNISFTDLTSMIVMQELGISQILTGDAHFTHVGFGFQIVPTH
jgi:predicted nucleic acid-binding protein